MNTILSKSVDYQTTKNPLQSLFDKRTKIKKKRRKKRKSIYHGIFNLASSIIPCLCGHTNKGSITICSCSNSRDLFRRTLAPNEIL